MAQQGQTYSEVVVGSDGSPTAQCAVRAASVVAAKLGARLTIATSWYRKRDDEPSTREVSTSFPGGSAAAMEARWAQETATDGAAIARKLGVEDIRQLTPEGGPADSLLELADEGPDTLVVVGTVGLTQRGERMVGNVPHQLTHHASRDLLLVGTEDCDDNMGWPRIALATDGSKTAAVACEHGLALARALGAEAVLLTVAASQKEGEAILAKAAGHFLGGEDLDRHIIENSSASGGLAKVGTDFDLLVIGNKGMSGPSRLLGSVSNRVTHEVPTDILLVNTTR